VRIERSPAELIKDRLIRRLCLSPAVRLAAVNGGMIPNGRKFDISSSDFFCYGMQPSANTRLVNALSRVIA
jgi:hypothetical protein